MSLLLILLFVSEYIDHLLFLSVYIASEGGKDFADGSSHAATVVRGGLGLASSDAGLLFKTVMPAPTSVPKTRVLVAAARSDVRQLISSMLKTRDDVVVIQADDGSAALMLANILKPQLLMLQATLPITSGFVVSSIVKQAPTLAQTPVILFDVPQDSVKQTDMTMFRCDFRLNTGWATHQMEAAIDRLLPKHH